MSLIQYISTEDALLKERDRLGKVLETELSLKLGKTKLNEKVAKILGAKDWNTALGVVRKSKQSSLEKANKEYETFYLNALNDWMSLKLDKDMLNELLYHLWENNTSTEFFYDGEYDNIPQEQRDLLHLYSMPKNLHKKLSIWDKNSSLMSYYGLFEKEFYSYLHSLETSDEPEIKKVFSKSKYKDLKIEELSSAFSYDQKMILNMLREDVEKLTCNNDLFDFEFIDVGDNEPFVLIEYSTDDSEWLKQRAEGFKDRFVMKLYIEFDKELNKFSYYGNMHTWNSYTGEEMNPIPFTNSDANVIMLTGAKEEGRTAKEILKTIKIPPNFVMLFNMKKNQFLKKYRSIFDITAYSAE